MINNIFFMIGLFMVLSSAPSIIFVALMLIVLWWKERKK